MYSTRKCIHIFFIFDYRYYKEYKANSSITMSTVQQTSSQEDAMPGGSGMNNANNRKRSREDDSGKSKDAITIYNYY